jgi:glycerate-2-kinase
VSAVDRREPRSRRRRARRRADVRIGAHPVPDAASVAATAAVLDLVGRAGADTLVLVLPRAALPLLVCRTTG